MKKDFWRTLTIMLVALLSFISCGDDIEEIEDIPNLKQYSALFEKTNNFINNLDIEYNNFNASGEGVTESTDGRFKIFPIGRLLIIEKRPNADNLTYDEVVDAIKTYYKDNSKVKGVFINVIGTITIDCSIGDEEYGSSDVAQYSSLLAKTDYFIDLLDKVYEHYDALGKETTQSSDRKFTITPMGRLIIVKINSNATNISYSEVNDVLKSYYKNNFKVKEVFINENGTITIDCRK